MKVSIIIPVYNVSKYIEKSIACICNQTMQEDVECIIVDDCTPDDSIEKIESLLVNYKGAITFNIVKHEKNRGLAAARNTGMQYATGDYVIHLDSDDYYESSMIEDLYNSAISNNADVVLCDFYQTYLNHEEIFQVTPINNTEEYVRLLIRHNYSNSIWNVWNKMIKRSIFYNHNISWTEGINFGEDVLICSKLFCFTNKVNKINKPLYHYTHYNVSSYTNTQNVNVEAKTMPILTDIENFLRENHLYAKYEKDINYRKLAIKISLLRFGDKKQQQYYNSLYPESNKYIHKCPDISFLSKIKLYAAHINLHLFNIIEEIHNFIIKRRK